MKVDIKTRESPGPFGKKNYVADFSVTFSEEEKGIIKHREIGGGIDLRDKGLSLPMWLADIFDIFPTPFSIAGLVIGFIVLIFTSFGWIIILGSIALFVAGRAYKRNQKRWKGRVIGLKELLANSTFTVTSDSTIGLSNEIASIEEQLATFKAVLETSTEVPVSKSYEL